MHCGEVTKAKRKTHTGGKKKKQETMSIFSLKHTIELYKFLKTTLFQQN